MDEKNELDENLDLPVVNEGEEDSTDWKSEAQKLRDKAIAQRERTKVLKNELKELRDFKAKAEVKPEPVKTNEPDYGKLAYLHARQITHDEDIKMVNEESDRLKLPLHAVLEMEHVKSRLKTNLEKREAADGLPSQGNRSGARPKDVEYWLAKGGLPDDQELAEKVVSARERQAVGKKFADEMFNN